MDLSRGAKMPVSYFGRLRRRLDRPDVRGDVSVREIGSIEHHEVLP